MEDFAMEWHDICRVCLRDGDLISFYTKDDCDITFCDKIMYCAAVNINTGENLPESICQTCVQDLEIAFKFRTLCENSDKILQSYKIDENPAFNEDDNETLVLAEKGGTVFQYKLPQDLKVQKVKTKSKKKGKKEQEVEQDTTEIQICKQELPDDTIEEITVKIEMNSDNEDELQLENECYNEETLDELSLAREIRLANAELIELDASQILDTEHMVELSDLDIKQENNGYLIIKKISGNDAEMITEEMDVKSSPKPAKGRRRRDDKIARPHMCEICGKTYRYNFNLEAHMRRHTGEKPFACNICGRGFVISFELRRHMRCHTGQKPYKCKYCERKFSDFGSRIKHQRSHTGERPYACDTCGKTFAYSHVLSSHKLIHSGIKAYKCDACDKRFTKAHHLKAHLNVHLRNGIVRVPKTPKIEPVDEMMEDELLLE